MSNEATDSNDPRALPIYHHEAEIVQAVRDHRVVVIQGPTGSGKTTQLPKMLHQAQLTDRVVGVTQPRRIAAVSVAWRIADELQVTLGEEVGYAIRFDDCTGPSTTTKIMTDGILLMEARTDPLFERYGIVVIDEAHERTLNIDFTLGLLHRALGQRTGLKVIVSSATLDPATFQRYFRDVAGQVGHVAIDARPYPVDIQYRPVPDDDNEGMMMAVAKEVIGIEKRGRPGHVLAFLSGEAMIKGTIDMIGLSRHGKNLWLLPLYGKLPRDEQERVFTPSPTRRKVVLATNIAETSITVPGVRYVVDSGLAKVPRVHQKTGITTLREEGVSKASADQRAGRAGRTAPGIAVRMYSRHAYHNRPAYTDEEILRLSLTDVVLRLIFLGVHDVERFALPTQPKRDAIRAAVHTLQQMGAIDQRRELTSIGRRMMPFPLSPQLSRMVVEAADRFPNVVDEVLMVAAFMSARSPFLYPAGEENEARAAQRGLAHPSGDACTGVNALRRYLAAKRPERFCQHNYLDPHTMAFIAKAYRQLKDIAQAHQITVVGGGSSDLVVRSVAAGFANNILRAKGRVYEGPGDTTIAIHPSSALFKANTRFVVACELVISARAYARSVSVMRPEWVADVNPQLAKRWHLSVRKQKQRRERDPQSLPSVLQLGEAALPVTLKRGRPSVTVATSDVAALTNVSLDGVPKRSLGWKTVLSSGRHSWGRGMKLGRLLCILPHLPLPAGEPKKFLGVPEGALLEIDRNLHTLARHLGQLLEPGLPAKGRHPGWLGLSSNGEGGFWFEVIGDYPDALSTTLGALKDLQAQLPGDDPLQAKLDPLIASTDTRDLEMDYALRAAKRF